MLAAWTPANFCCAALACLALALVGVLGLLRDMHRRNEQLCGEKERLDYELSLALAQLGTPVGIPTNACGVLGEMQDPVETLRQQDEADSLHNSATFKLPLFTNLQVATGLPVVERAVAVPLDGPDACAIVITAPSLVASSDLLTPAAAAARGPPTFAPPPTVGDLSAGRAPRRSRGEPRCGASSASV